MTTANSVLTILQLLNPHHTIADHARPAMHRALCIPEILSLIFDEIERIDFRTLLSCSRVDRRWHDAIIRRIWWCCKDYYYPLVTPQPWQLVSLNWNVQQGLADYITRLVVTCVNERYKLNPRQLDAWTIPALARLEWHSLRELTFELPPPSDQQKYDVSDLSSLATPTLRVLCIQILGDEDNPVPLPESFMIDLTQNCPGLLVFRVQCSFYHIPWSIDPSTLASLIDAAHSLEDFEWGTYEGLSYEVLIALARKGSLKSLRIQCILFLIWHGEWQDEYFTNLKHLSSRIQPDALPAILPKLRLLESLSFETNGHLDTVIQGLNSTVSNRILQLRIFLELPQVIRSSVLLAFVESAKQLQVLDLAGCHTMPYYFDLDYLSMAEWNDGDMEQLAAALPNLRELILPGDCDNPQLTQRSLLSLGRHCPKLEKCHLSLSCDFDDLLQHARPTYWQRLYQLTIWGPGDKYAAEDGPESLEAIRVIARKIKQAMPSLGEMTMRDPSALESQLAAFIGWDERAFKHAQLYDKPLKPYAYEFSNRP